MKTNEESGTKHNLPVSQLHKQILEIKKKIQLSEGQRKAVFEDCENEHKLNVEKVRKLKEEIQQLITNLNNFKTPTYGKRLERVIAIYDNKTFEEIQDTLQLQTIDKEKHLNLLNYELKLNQKFLLNLSQEYQKIISGKAGDHHIPFKSKIFDLQNNIHAIEIQLREALHISIRYNDIKKTLLDDTAKFESNIQKIMKEIGAQLVQVNNLLEVVEEATALRTQVRSMLLEEERKATSTANNRDRQTTEGQRLVNSGKQQLEIMEKFMFQGQKIPKTNQEGGIIEDITNDEYETPETPQSDNDLLNIFEQLKQATGGTSNEEIYERFISQRDTKLRLLQMRMKSEINKKTLEIQSEKLTIILEQFRYSENKEKDSQSLLVEELNNKIAMEQKRQKKFILQRQEHRESMQSLLNGIQELHHCINPLQTDLQDMNPLQIVRSIYDNLSLALSKVELKQFESKVVTMGVSEEKGLPAPYNTLIRKTPLPRQNSSPAPPVPPPGSEDEEDVPSRNYLKRQAQLVIDAKLRRKKH